MKKTTLVLFCIAYFISLDALAFGAFKKKHLAGIKSVAIVSVYTNVPYLGLEKRIYNNSNTRSGIYPNTTGSYRDNSRNNTGSKVVIIKKPVRLNQEHLPELHQYIHQQFSKVFKESGWSVSDHEKLVASLNYKKYMADVYDRSREGSRSLRHWIKKEHDWLPMQGMTVYQINNLQREERRAGEFSKTLGVDAIAAIECVLKFHPYNAFGGLGSAIARTRCRIYMVTSKGKYAIYGVNVNRWLDSDSRERVKMYDGEINVGPEKSKRMMKQSLDLWLEYYKKKFAKNLKK